MSFREYGFTAVPRIIPRQRLRNQCTRTSTKHFLAHIATDFFTVYLRLNTLNNYSFFVDRGSKFLCSSPDSINTTGTGVFIHVVVSNRRPCSSTNVTETIYAEPRTKYKPGQSRRVILLLTFTKSSVTVILTVERTDNSTPAWKGRYRRIGRFIQNNRRDKHDSLKRSRVNRLYFPCVGTDIIRVPSGTRYV